MLERLCLHGIAKQQHNKPTGAPSRRGNTFTLPRRPTTRSRSTGWYYYVPKRDHVETRARQRPLGARQPHIPGFLSAPGGAPLTTTTNPRHGRGHARGLPEDDVWVVRFPFGLHWGDQGIGYVSFEYFDRYNRDRWLIDIDECSEPPEYRQQREAAQAKGDTAETGLLAVRMDAANGEPRVAPTQVPSCRSGGGSAMALRRYG